MSSLVSPSTIGCICSFLRAPERKYTSCHWMYWSSWPASEGMFSICETALSPWHALHVSTFSLTSAARAKEPTIKATPDTAATNSLSISPPHARRGPARPAGQDEPCYKRSISQKVEAAVPEHPQPQILQPALLAVADAVDRTRPVVGDEDRAILVEDDVVGTTEIALVALDPAGREHFLLGVLAIGPDGDAHDAATLVLVTIPGAVLGDQDGVLVLGGELASGIELHAERSDVGAELVNRRCELRALVTRREFRIRQIALVAIGIAEMLAHPVDHVELVGGQVVADPVAGVFREPVFAGARIDVAADRVADAERIDFRVAGLGIDAADLRDAGRGNADIEGRSERNIEPAVLVDRDIFPAMRGIGRHVVIDHLALAEIVEIGLGIVVADQLVDCDHVERTVAEGETGGHVQPL